MGNIINLELFLQYLFNIIPLVMILTTKQRGNVYYMISSFNVIVFIVHIYDPKKKRSNCSLV